jgi:hypothetical protein
LPNAVKPLGFISACHTVFQSGLAKFDVMPVLSWAMAWLQATAISRTAFSQVVGENPALFSALTLAEPECSRPSFLGVSDAMRAYDGPMGEGLIS